MDLTKFDDYKSVLERFQDGAEDPYYYKDVYGVVVSTDGENFQVILDEAFEAPTEGFEVRTADLSQYAGQTVHIGFVHKNGGGNSNGIGIDNVKYSFGIKCFILLLPAYAQTSKMQ